jgi:hypothetical protein
MWKQIEIAGLIFCISCCMIGTVWAGSSRSRINGDPKLTMTSPLGKKDIEDTPYNRCRIIQMMNPPMDKATEAQRNQQEILSNYVANVYAQAFKVSGYIATEKDAAAVSLDKSNEIKLLENGMERPMSEIARRFNIINSLEAGIVMMESLDKLRSLPKSTFRNFDVLEDGKIVQTDDCEKLK